MRLRRWSRSENRGTRREFGVDCPCVPAFLTSRACRRRYIPLTADRDAECRMILVKRSTGVASMCAEGGPNEVVRNNARRGIVDVLDLATTSTGRSAGGADDLMNRCEGHRGNGIG